MQLVGGVRAQRRWRGQNTALGSVLVKRTCRESQPAAHFTPSGPGSPLCTAWMWLAVRSSSCRYFVASIQAEGIADAKVPVQG